MLILDFPEPGPSWIWDEVTRRELNFFWSVTGYFSQRRCVQPGVRPHRRGRVVRLKTKQWKKMIDQISRGWVIFEVKNYRWGCLELFYPYKIRENLPSDFSGVKKCLIFWWPRTLTSVWLNRRSSTFSRLRPHPRPSRGGSGRCGGSCSCSGSSCESYWLGKDGSLKKKYRSS